MAWPGEKQAWDILTGLDSKDVKTRANVIFNSHNSTYELACFGQDVYISLTNRDIFGTSSLGKFLVKELREYSRLSILRYLIHAKDLPLSGQLVRPSDLPGGDIFLKGTHVIPLDKIAEYFSNNFKEFLNIGKSLDGSQLEYGDISLKLSPFPRVPVVLIVWSGDEEFSSKSSLLFDSSCVSHLSTDIIWSTAMMAVEVMLINIKAYNQTLK
ncbi:MAG: DUF3786 domain-containing protein [Candidatus Scalinduaceae bacterium]